MDQREYNVWFGKRLQEILEEKGLPVKSLSSRSGIGRMTLSRIMRGRYATAEELKKMADALEISVERLKRKDVDYNPTSISRDREIKDFDEELRKAVHQVGIALGVTEKGLAYQALGALNYCAGNMHQAAIEYGRSFMYLQHHEDPQVVYLSIESLVHTYLASREYDLLDSILEEAEHLLRTDNSAYAQLLQLKANVFVKQKRFQEAIGLYHSMNEIDRHADAACPSRHSLAMLGTCHLFLGHFVESLQYFEQWAQCFSEQEQQGSGDQNIYFLHYAKSLFASGQIEKAARMLESRLSIVLAGNNPRLAGNFLLFLSICKKDRVYAQRALSYECDAETRLISSLIISLTQKEQNRDEMLIEQLRDQMVFDYLFTTNLRRSPAPVE